MGNHGETVSAIALLPWLQVHEPISFAGFSFEHLSSVAARVPASWRMTVQLIASTFGDEADPVVCWACEEGRTPTFGQPDVSRMHDRVRLLAIAAMSKNQYFQVHTPANSSHFELVIQCFTPGDEYFAIERRRRDGRTLSGGHRYNETRFHRPQATFGKLRIRWDREVLHALEACLREDTALGTRIQQSAVAFVAGNRLDDFSSPEADVVWATTALEQLLGVSARKGVGITAAFIARLSEALTVPYTSPVAGNMIASWAKELYDKRSALHGKPAKTDVWSSGWHAMLATVAYGICIRTLMAKAGRYSLKPEDHWDALAFPFRVAALRTARLPAPPNDAGQRWHESGTRASWRWAHYEMRARLQEDGGE